jgi:hypothetical protein
VGDPDLDGMLDELIARVSTASECDTDREAVRQIMVTALRLVSDGTSARDVKLANSALKELRQTFRVFEPYRAIRKLSVFGSARTALDHPTAMQAGALSQRMTEKGWMVITGAGDGIMRAAQRGAGRSASFGVNIQLPFEQRANPTIAGDAKLINYRYFFTRKVAFVKESHAIVLFPGGFGTHDEGHETLTLIQTGKSELVPIVFVDEPGGTYWKEWRDYVVGNLVAGGLISERDVSLFRVTDDIDEAVNELVGFYANYHSTRFIGNRAVVRLRKAPTESELATLNESYASLLVDGEIARTEPLPEENAEFSGLPRLTLEVNRREIGRFRELIDDLNRLVGDADTSTPIAPSPLVIPELPLPEGAEHERDA